MSKYGVRAKVMGLCREALAAWAVALVALVAGGLLSAGLALATQAFYKQQLRQRFELLASERYSRIAERFDDQEQRLDSLRRFFSFSNEITPRRIRRFRRPAAAPHPGLLLGATRRAGAAGRFRTPSQRQARAAL